MRKRMKKYQGIPLATFGPLYNADGDGGGAATKTPPAPGATPAASQGDEPLGEGGKKALDKEREQRKQLEQTVAQLKQAQEAQTAALAEALGVKVDKKQDVDAVVSDLQQKITEMQRSASVDRIARAHGITDTDDIALIGEARSEEAMEKVAGRLKVATPGTPKPDTTQGPKDPPPPVEPKPGVSRLAAAFDQELDK